MGLVQAGRWWKEREKRYVDVLDDSNEEIKNWETVQRGREGWLNVETAENCELG